jgi:hypothetical protein
MYESENSCVKHRARRFDFPTCVVADVDAFADQDWIPPMTVQALPLRLASTYNQDIEWLNRSPE